ncbi:type II toxin-antitoxin system RelE/ParE family toxin [candidate division WOR-3 bacterium]|nr:type II toxin-antitoxin system RelE/ParE family toxin [candidate division WOR-3 bacterium]
MSYRVRIAERAARHIRALDKQIKERIKTKLRWLGDNAEAVIHHRLSMITFDNEEVYRLRIISWRVFYHLSRENKEIQVLEVIHRSEANKDINWNNSSFRLNRFLTGWRTCATRRAYPTH